MHDDTINYWGQILAKKQLGAAYERWICNFCGTEISNTIDGHIGIVEEGIRWSRVYRCKKCRNQLSKRVTTSYEKLELDSEKHRVEHGFRRSKEVSESYFNYQIFQALTEIGFVGISNSFLHWCSQYVLEVLRKISTTIRPEVYNEVAKMQLEASRHAENSRKAEKSTMEA